MFLSGLKLFFPTPQKENLQSNDLVESVLYKISPPWVQFYSPTWLNDFLDSRFSFFEFNVALDSKNIKSAPGMDRIDFDILKELFTKYKFLLLNIFNNIFDNNDYTYSWKCAVVHCVKMFNGLNFQPISLTSCTCELFETIIKNELQYWAEIGNLFADSQ